MPAQLIDRRLSAGLIAASVSLCLVATEACAAQVSVTIYGRLNIATEFVRARAVEGSANATRLSNNRSVLGFRGEEDLGDGLKAIWQIEGAVGLDNGTGGLASRDTRVGLTGELGTLFAGQWTLPYTSSTSSYDPFYPTTAGYMALMGNGSASSTDNVINTAAFDRRQRNVVQYWSPTLYGLSSRIAYAFNEETVAETGAKPWLLSASALYEHGPWQLTLAHEIHHGYQAAHGSDKATKIGAMFVEGSVRLAAAIEHIAYDTATGGLRRNSGYVSASYRLGAVTLHTSLCRAWRGSGSSADAVGFVISGKHTGATHWTVGAEYAFSSRTSAYVFFSEIDNGSAGRYDFAINESRTRVGASPTAVAFGIRHAF